jgi:hypothetical protein
MTTPQVIALVAVILCIDAMIVGAIFHTAGQTLRDIAKAFPPQPHLPNTPTRNFRTVRIGIINLGGSVHIAIDGNHVHLAPSWFARRIGMTPASVPHACIEVPANDLAKARERVKGFTNVKLRREPGAAATEISLPGWVVAASLTLRES